MKGNLDILFIHPPYERLMGFSLRGIPSGVLGLATYINQKGFKSLVYNSDSSLDDGIVDYDNKNRAEMQKSYGERIDDDDYYVWKEIRDTIKMYDPRFVGISVMTPALHGSLKIARIARELGRIVLIGGTHVTIVKEKVLELDSFDFAFFGEGEYSVIEFLNSYPDIEKLRKVKGLGFVNEGKTIYNGFPERIRNLDSLPFPDRKLLVFNERYMKTDLSSIMASRGCPHDCSFCASVPIWGRHAVFRSPKNIIQEIKYLRDNYGIKEFRFYDDTFTAKKTNVINFCKLLVSTFGKKYFTWWCLSRVNTIDEEILYWLKMSGCDRIDLGIESGSDKVLKLMRKGITISQAEKSIKLAKKHKFWVHTFFIIGFPYETLEDIRQTIDFIKKVKPDSVNLCTFTPHPGTELYDYCIEKKLLVHDDGYELYKNIGHHSTNNFFSEHISRNEYRKVLDEMLCLTSDITNCLTMRKLMFRLRRLTVQKVRIKIKIMLKKIRFKIDGRINC